MSAPGGTRATRCGLGLSLLMTTIGVSAEPVRIEAFTDTARFPLSGREHLPADVTVQDLGLAKRLERSLSVGLPKEEAAARRLAEQRIQGNLEALSAQFLTAYQSHTAAMTYGITRYPALVFDQGRAVLYGETDLRAGLARYQRWLAAQPVRILTPNPNAVEIRNPLPAGEGRVRADAPDVTSRPPQARIAQALIPTGSAPLASLSPQGEGLNSTPFTPNPDGDGEE